MESLRTIIAGTVGLVFFICWFISRLIFAVAVFLGLVFMFRIQLTTTYLLFGLFIVFGWVIYPVLNIEFETEILRLRGKK